MAALQAVDDSAVCKSNKRNTNFSGTVDCHTPNTEQTHRPCGWFTSLHSKHNSAMTHKPAGASIKSHSIYFFLCCQPARLDSTAQQRAARLAALHTLQEPELTPKLTARLSRTAPHSACCCTHCGNQQRPPKLTVFAPST